VPGLATKEWVEEYRQKCAPDPDQHAEYKVRVKGEFAGQGLNNPVTLDALTRAEKRWASTEPEGPLVVGLDAAREGDDTSVAAPRRGKKVFQLEALPPGDGKVVADHCVARVAKHKPPGQDRIKVNVDAIGIGASAYDHLKRRKDVEAVAINNARAADDSEHHHNLRSQIFFGVGDFLAEGGALPPDPALRAEFLAHTYFFDTQGRYQLPEKKDIKKKIKRSPDRADAVTLAVYRRRGIVWPKTGASPSSGGDDGRDYSGFAG
jgi:phage terminase large subunit